MGVVRRGTNQAVLYATDNCHKALAVTESDSEAVKGDGEAYWYRKKG